MSATALPRYLVTATLARSATESAGPALLLVAIATLGSAQMGSYLVASLTASAAIAGPIVGVLLDRTASPRAGFAVAMTTMALGLAAIALAITRAPLGIVMVLALVAGLGYPAITGAWSAQLPRLVPREHLTKAYSSDAATYSVAAVVAPPVAAALVAVSTTAPLWLPVLLLVASLGLLRIVPLHADQHSRPTTSLLSNLKEGASTIVRGASLRRTTVITVVGFGGQAAIFVAAPLLAQELTGSLQFTGVILGSFALGGVLSALWFANRPVQRPDRAIIVSMLLSGALLILVGIAPTTWFLLAAAFLMGATEPPLVAGMFLVRQREAPTRVQSQVFTTSASLRLTAFAIATAICGTLIPLGVWSVIAFGVLLHFVSVLIGVWLGPPLPPRDHWFHRTAR
jgi:MFS family permease